MGHPPSHSSLHSDRYPARRRRLCRRTREILVVGAILPHPAHRLFRRDGRHRYSRSRRPQGSRLPPFLEYTGICMGGFLVLIHAPDVYGEVLVVLD